MAYKSLYRKYRPTTFDDVSGQTFIIKTLKNAIATNKISHAYLFSGTRGTGKTTIAKIFAKNVNCMNLIDGNVCGKCEICTTENTDDIQDIIEIDAASNNGVDEIRELKNKIKLAPVLCKYKVYIIDEVHMLSTGAFNALLKTLEEPPSHVIFILATTEPQKIPITIISRCQRFDFKKLSIIDIKNRLKYIAEKEHINITDDCLDEIAKMSDGAMRDAIGLLDQVSSFNEDSITIDDIYQISGSVPFKKIYELIDSYINEDIENILKTTEEIYNEGKDFTKLTFDVLSIFKDVLIYYRAPKYFENLNKLNFDEIKKINAEYRNINNPTDVLSFPMLNFALPGDFDGISDELENDVEDYFNPDSGELMLGDIVVSVEKVVEQAEKYGHSQERELAFLVAHSMMHLFGYDHMEPDEAAVMESKQREILDNLGITR